MGDTTCLFEIREKFVENIQWLQCDVINMIDTYHLQQFAPIGVMRQLQQFAHQNILGSIRHLERIKLNIHNDPPPFQLRATQEIQEIQHF